MNGASSDPAATTPRRRRGQPRLGPPVQGASGAENRNWIAASPGAVPFGDGGQAKRRCARRSRPRLLNATDEQDRNGEQDSTRALMLRNYPSGRSTSARAAPRTRCAASAGTCRPAAPCATVTTVRDQLGGVRRERRRIARDVDDPAGRGLDDPPHDLLRQTRAGGSTTSTSGRPARSPIPGGPAGRRRRRSGRCRPRSGAAFAIASAIASSTSSRPHTSPARGAISSPIVPIPQYRSYTRSEAPGAAYSIASR